jgi:hypothetical protein
VSDWYGVKDAACPISTKKGGGGERANREGVGRLVVLDLAHEALHGVRQLPHARLHDLWEEGRTVSD